MNKQIIVHIIPSLEIGGAEMMLEGLVLEQSKNHVVFIISLYNYNTDISNRIINNNIKVIFLNKKHGIDLKLLFSLRKVLKSIKPNIIHTHLYALNHLLLSLFFRRKSIFHTLHTTVDKEFGLFNRLFISLFYRLKIVNPIVISNQIQQSFIKLYRFKTPPPIIWNGVELNKIPSKENYKVNSVIKIVHIGNFKEAKNHVNLINKFYELIKINPNYELNLIGTGELLPVIQKLVFDLKLKSNVVFLGQRNDVRSILKEFDIFVLPSLWEGMPISIIEAMAAGLPIICSRVGGIPDMIDSGENGILIDSDLNQFINTIVYISSNQMTRELLGLNAKKKSIMFSSENMAEKYMLYYEFIKSR